MFVHEKVIEVIEVYYRLVGEKCSSKELSL